MFSDMTIITKQSNLGSSFWFMVHLIYQIECQWLDSNNLLQDIGSNLISTSSSSFQDWIPERTFDNNPSLYPDLCGCCFATNSNVKAFWQIDLGQTYLIFSIEVLSRSDIDFIIGRDTNSTRSDKDNVIKQFSGFLFAVSNNSMTSLTDGEELTSFQNSYRYYIPLAPPSVFQHFRVERRTQYYLTICEVRMFSKEPTNLIKSIKNDVTVTVSSPSNEATKEKAIDGNSQYYPDLCNCCSMVDGNGGQTFWQIDLGKQYLISVVEVISRADVDVIVTAERYLNRSDSDKATIRSQYQNLTIAISNTTITSFDNVLEVASHEHRFVALLNTPVEFRFLRIGRSSSDQITLCDVKLLEPDVNKCSRNAFKCDVNAVCEDMPGSYQCVCNHGYTGDGLTCEDIDECANKEKYCSQYAVCINTERSFSCVCPDGFEGNGFNCTDINECEYNTHNCSVNGLCINVNGSFNCSCSLGYKGDGWNCADVDECQDTSHLCSANANCTNNIGSYNCTCETGFEGDGNICIDLNECESDIHTCSNDGHCINEIGSFDCACNNGYTGDGWDCEDTNECQEGSHLCSADAICTNTVGSYTCTCKSGFEGDGKSCRELSKKDSGQEKKELPDVQSQKDRQAWRTSFIISVVLNIIFIIGNAIQFVFFRRKFKKEASKRASNMYEIPTRDGGEHNYDIVD